MFRKALHILYFFLVSGCCMLNSHVFSQNVFSSEEDLKKQANKLFENEDFAKSYPLFSQLLSLYPKDPQYNYKFGTCLLFSSNDKEKAIPYLEFAARRQKQEVDKEVFFYLGKAYHLNYRFADAIKSYTAYKGMASSKQAEKYGVDRQMEMCENGKHLLKNITDLSVFEKKEVPVSDFFRSYNLSEFNAKLIICPEDLKTSYDKKKKEDNVMYLAPDRNEIYYSSYGENGKNGKDIYFVTRTPGGDLSTPVRVSDVINTKYDEDYAFLHPNGKTLYFCSKGHNSMGGYDIFKSEWDDNTRNWGNPVNMDFAINTPDDDILFISDSEDKSAYFSSRRGNAEGSITVYKIKLDRKPLDIAIIAGTLAKNIGDKTAKAIITVTKVPWGADPSGKDEVVGIFNTNAGDGSYTLKLSNGGKFMFTVESAGFKKSSELVVVPIQQEIKPLKQAISLVHENGQDKIIIKNEFDAQIDSADLALAIQYIKEKALLEINSDEEEITAVVEEVPPASHKGEQMTQIPTSKDGGSPVTNADIIEMAYQDAKETQQEANEMIKKSDAAQKLATQKNDLSMQKYKEAQNIMKQAETITNQDEKLSQIDKSAALRKESEILSTESALALTLSNQMNELASEKQLHADAEMKYAKNLDDAIKSNASEKKMNELLAQKEELDKQSEILDAPFPPDMYKHAEAKENEANKIMAKYTDLQQDVEYLQSESKRLRAEAKQTKNDELKQNMILQAEEAEKEAEIKKKEAETYSASATQLQLQADSIKNSAALTSSIMKEILPMTIGTEQATKDKIQAASISSGENPASQTSSPPLSTVLAEQGLKSPYVDVFVNQMHETEKKSNELEKEEALAVIYQSWTDSLDNQIASLKERLASTTSKEDKPKIQDKIYELQSSVDEKRQKAADSRNKVDNLKLHEALAIASDISTESSAGTTAAVSDTTDTTAGTLSAASETIPPADIGTNAQKPDNITGVENINDYYENKLKGNEKVTNEYEKKVKEQELYTDWSASLYDESLRLKKDGHSGKAEDAMNESKTKQASAIQSADQVTQIKAEHPDLAASANFASPETPSPAETSGAKTTSTVEQTISSTTTASPETATISSYTATETTSASTTNAKTETPPKNKIINQPSNQKTENPTTEATEQMEPTITSFMPVSVKNKDEYTHYTALKKESDWSKRNADRQYTQADEAQKIADNQFKESQQISKQIENTADPNKRQQLQQQSEALDLLYLKNQAQADSIKKIAQNTEAEANAKRTESELYLQSLDKAVYEEIVSATGYKTTPITTGNEPTAGAAAQTESATRTQTAVITYPETAEPKIESSTREPSITSSTTTISKEVPSDKTETTTHPAITETSTSSITTAKSTNTPVVPSASSELIKYYDALFDKIEFSGAVYSPSKPIPVDAPMPEGLTFKVQIGAFRNPIPQNLFKGIKPITAETTPQGFKRYTAGLFQKFSTADNAKNQVNGLGYRDAFVVAFFNGKRIPLSDALAKAKESGENIDLTAVSIGSAHTTSASIVNSANATDVKSVNGLFYTIQIGVFSKPVTPAQLYNISPLNNEKTDNGLIRYTTGRFDDEIKASKSKNNIAEKGISDAFVVAYFNGKRISLADAKTVIISQGKSILAKDKQEYSFVPSDTTTSESSAKSLTTSSNLGIVFKVQVGAYKEQVPIDIANQLLANSGKGIKTFKDENGLTLYTTGEFLEYESANNLKTQLISNGLSDAFVIAFKDGKKMSAADALDLIKNR